MTSCFGVIFAPRHQQAAAQLVRVARPGGRIVLTAWTPEGVNGQMFETFGSYLPAPPPGMGTPVEWGSEQHVRSLFADTGAALEFERRTVTFTADSPEAWLAYNERVLGPAIVARETLQPQGRWAELRGDWLALYERANEARDGSFRADVESCSPSAPACGLGGDAQRVAQRRELLHHVALQAYGGEARRAEWGPGSRSPARRRAPG